MVRGRAEQRTLDVIVELHGLRGCILPEVRAWVDLDPTANLRSETELALKCVRRWCWQAPLWVEHQLDHFCYRLGFRAHTGAEWSLRVYDRAARRDLVVDGDSLGLDKCWLVGCCVVPAPAGPGGAADETRVVRADLERVPRSPRRGDDAAVTPLAGRKPRA